MPVTTNEKYDVIDGWNRLTLAAELDIDCPMAVRLKDELEKDLRSPWTDLIISRSTEEVEEGLIVPIAWVEDTLVATQLRRI